ncbi:MAG: ribonuclease E inhibitor RraB [Planctomycetota bacterium]
MLVQSLIILFGVLGAIMVFGFLTKLVQRAPREWRELVELFPPEQPSLDAKRVEVLIRMGRFAKEGVAPFLVPGCLAFFFMPWRAFSGMQRVRYAVDQEALHLELADTAGSRTAMSLPWAAVEVGRPMGSHMGDQVQVVVEGVVMLFPAASIEDELEVRAALRAEEAAAAAEQADAMQVQSLAAQGLDITSLHVLEFVIEVRDEASAQQLSSELQSEFEVEERAPTVAGQRWAVAARRAIVPDADTLVELRRRFSEDARRFGGNYVGWSVAPE